MFAKFRRKVVEPDLALVHVSEPDKHGYCSLGTSVDIARAALEHSKHTIALVNKHMPRTLGMCFDEYMRVFVLCM